MIRMKICKLHNNVRQ